MTNSQWYKKCILGFSLISNGSIIIRILNYILLFLYRTTSGGAGPRNNSFNTNSIQKINTSHPGERQSFRTTRLNATASSLSPASDDPDLIPLQTSTKNLQLGKLKLIFPSNFWVKKQFVFVRVRTRDLPRVRRMW